jgi:hypothetical protein
VLIGNADGHREIIEELIIPYHLPILYKDAGNFSLYLELMNF